MTRGRRGSLLLRRKTLPFSTLCRFVPAHIAVGTALAHAWAAPRPGLVRHSDRGSPYASADYIAELERFGMVRSMSRKADCWDNAVAESVFSTLKTELIGGSIPSSVDAARAAIGEYIEVFCNARRRHSSIGYASPIEYELKSQILSVAAW